MQDNRSAPDFSCLRPSYTKEPREAVVICTRNRPDDLKNTLASIAQQEHGLDLCVVVVDGSEAEPARQNERLVAQFEACPMAYLRYPGRPAATRQRNYGVDALPGTVEIVHFIDDDVTVLPGYFSHLSAALRHHPEAGGVGGVILAEHPLSHPRDHTWLKSFFLLAGKKPGLVLLSGRTTMVQEPSHTLVPTEPTRVEWLSTCSAAYRRAVFSHARFDEAVEGPSPRLEDLDFSYRVGHRWPLLIEPKARLIHHFSPASRQTVAGISREGVVRRYWFVEKNITHPLRKLAFWWSVLGCYLAILSSPKRGKWEALRGLMDGTVTILRRTHPLLRR